MSTLPSISVVVPVCNHAVTIGAVLDALDATDWPDLEIVVVDCGSIDGSLPTLRERAQRGHGVPFRLIERPGSGRASALNHGFEAAGRREVVRVHGDVVPDDPQWLRQLHAVFARHPEVGVLGCKIVLAGGRIQTCGRDLIRGLGIGETSDRRWLEGDVDEPCRATEVDGVSGELCWIRREVLDATGGLDPAYDPVFGDDDDFCLLARWHGFRVMVEPGVRAVHYAPRWSTTTNAGVPDASGLLGESLAARQQLLTAHLGYFQAKWGFDPRSPDLHEMRRRYGHTRICWRIGERLLEQLPQRPAVDVCLVTWNSMAVLPRMLDHLAATRWSDLRVWITDNGSSDGTVEWLAERAATLPFPLHVQRLPTNVGVAPALNIAFQAGTAPLVARLDDDTVVSPDWLERLVPRFHQRPYAGMVAPKVLHDNVGQGLQNGPLRMWPGSLDGIGAGSEALVDGLVRVVTQRGCCNVYRRSVFREVGWLDVRYAPSQFDEWDHHIATCNAGYEVLYDGSVAVRHLLTAGRMATPSSIGSYAGNLQKTKAKWGPEHLRSLDRGIDLSIDGRCLPPDGDTTALRARLPAVPPGPPRGPGRDAAAQRDLHALARRRSLLRSPAGPLAAWWRGQVELGEQALACGQPLANAVVMKLMDLLPNDARALLLLARFRRFDGDEAAAVRTAKWALRLAPGDPELEALTANAAATETPPVVIPAAPRSEPVRVLLVPPMELAEDIGQHAVDLVAAALHEARVPFRIARELVPVPGEASVVHAFGFAEVTTLLGRLQAVRAQAPRARLVLSPLAADPAVANWVGRVVGERFLATDADVRAWLVAAAAGKIEVDGTAGRSVPGDPDDDRRSYERACLDLCDGLVLHHPATANWLAMRHGTLPPASCMLEGFADSRTPSAAGDAPDLPGDGILAVGPRDLPDNHLPLVLAADGLRVPVTLCGRPAHPFAEWRTRARGGDWLQWESSKRGAELATAMAKRAVFAWLPSAPTTFALPLQAATLGCQLVLARAVGAEAVFGDRARYVDPLDVPALRQALIDALAAARSQRADGWLAEHRHRLTSAAYARRLLAVYGLAIDGVAAAPMQPSTGALAVSR